MDRCRRGARDAHRRIDLTTIPTPRGGPESARYSRQLMASQKFEKHARTFALLTMLSRVTGLARDATLSRVFGAGPLMDAFFFAFIIPNLFRRLFGEGALSAAFLPVYSELERDDPAAASRLATLLITRLMLLLGAVVLVGEFLLWLAHALSAGDDMSHLSLRLMMLMLPYMPLVCLVALLGAMLQVHGRFGPTAAAPIILNLCIIGSAIGLSLMADDAGDADRARHVMVVACSVVLAGALQCMWALIALRRSARWVRTGPDVRPHLSRVMHQAGPMMVGLGVLQLNTLFDGLIASYPTTIGPTILGRDYPLDEGAMSAVSYAQRLYQFPLGVFGIAIATAIFPALARLNDHSLAFTATLRRGLRLVVFIGVPASAGLLLVRIPLTTVILQGGDFTADDTVRVANVLLGYGIAVWAYSMTHVLTRAFYAKGDARTPVRVAISIVGLNLVLNCILIWTPLREAGLAWSTAVSAAIQAAALLFIAERRSWTGQHIVDAEVRGSWMRTFAGSAAMIAIAGFIANRFAPTFDSALDALLPLTVIVCAGVIVFGGCALTMRMPEWRWAIGRSNADD